MVFLFLHRGGVFERSIQLAVSKQLLSTGFQHFSHVHTSCIGGGNTTDEYVGQDFQIRITQRYSIQKPSNAIALVAAWCPDRAQQTRDGAYDNKRQTRKCYEIVLSARFRRFFGEKKGMTTTSWDSFAGPSRRLILMPKRRY